MQNKNAGPETVPLLAPRPRRRDLSPPQAEQPELAGSPPSTSRPEGDPAESRTFVTAFARGLLVMKAFTSQSQHMTLSDVSQIVDLPRATVRRCLLTLQSLGYVTSKDRYFSLSPMVLTLAQAYLTSSVLPRVSQSFLERLSDQMGESCSMSILHGQEVIYVARSTRKRIASLHREVGSHLPAHCTSMGRVLLAALPEPELDRFLEDATLTAYTKATITVPAKLRTILEKVAKTGYCLVDQELEVDLRTMAVPVRNAAGTVVGAINVSTQASRTRRATMIDEFLPLMRQAAAELRPLIVS